MDTRIPRSTLPLLVACCLAVCASAAAQTQATPSPQSREKFGDPAQYETTDRCSQLVSATLV
jgi:hypothetical protein